MLDGKQHDAEENWMPGEIKARREASEDEGRCRFNCRTAKENFIEGYVTACENVFPTDFRPRAAHVREAEHEWKRRQATTRGQGKDSG